MRAKSKAKSRFNRISPQYGVTAKLIRSPETVTPEITAVVVVLEVCTRLSVVVVRSFALANHPFGAIYPGVIVTVQVPVVPELNCPADEPPIGVAKEHPVTLIVPPVPR